MKFVRVLLAVMLLASAVGCGKTAENEEDTKSPVTDLNIETDDDGSE